MGLSLFLHVFLKVIILQICDCVTSTIAIGVAAKMRIKVAYEETLTHYLWLWP